MSSFNGVQAVGQGTDLRFLRPPLPPLLSLEFVINIAGVATSYWMEFGLQYRSSRSESFSWRFPLAFQVAFILILLACIPLFRKSPCSLLALLCRTDCSSECFSAESPRWLARMGREDEARYILAQCRTEDGVSDHVLPRPHEASSDLFPPTCRTRMPRTSTKRCTT